MIVPEYWAEARLQTKEDGKQITIRRFGWSDESQEAAEALAQERAAEAMQRARAGEKLERREFKTPYNGADGVPIREEIMARHGDVVITRNCYGAPCLNTPDVLFLDVDFEEKAGCGQIMSSLRLRVNFPAHDSQTPCTTSVRDVGRNRRSRAIRSSSASSSGSTNSITPPHCSQ